MQLGDILFAVNKGMMANLALKLSITAVVVVDVFMRSRTERANNRVGNRSSVTASDRFNSLAVSFMIVFDKECIILLN